MLSLHPELNKDIEAINEAQAKDYIRWCVVETALVEIEPHRHSAEILAKMAEKKAIIKAKFPNL